MSLNINRELTGFRFVAIRGGDTMQTIAARELGNTSKWPDLVAINELSWPYIVNAADLTDSTRTYGDTIIVPAAAIVGVNNTDPESALGTDAILIDGFLTTDGSDIATVSGIGNYAQAIENAIQTERGELIWHLSYGCDVRKLLGTVNGPTAMLLARSYVRGTILADPRTQEIISLTASSVGAAIPVTAKVVPISGNPVTINTSI